MTVNGRDIAAAIYEENKAEVATLKQAPRLTVFTAAPNFATQKYLALKKQKANDVGIDFNVVEFPESVTTEDMIDSIKALAHQTDGLVVQLPLPPSVDTEAVLVAIPSELDVDAVNYAGDGSKLLPPVVGAIEAIAKKHQVDFADRQVVVVGEGRLVGKPAALWARAEGGMVEVVNRETANSESILKNADIIISGAGQPGLIKADDVKEGVIIFDAGTSEEGGELKGDVDAACALKAALFTPVPGGIGPVTIAILLRNLVSLAKARSL